MIFLEIEGEQFEGFTNVTVRKSLDELSGAFNFTATSDETADYPINRRAKVKVFVDDTKVIDGIIDRIDINYSDNSHILSISGRDKTSILVDSSIPGSRAFNAPTDLRRVTENILSQLGSSIKVIENGITLREFKKNLVANIEDTAFQFLERYARKSNVILTTNFDGNVVITQAGIEKIDTLLLNEKSGEKNNIKSAVISFDDSKRFSKYIVYAQQLDNDDISNKSEATVKASATDSEALSTKQKNIILESEGDIDTVQDRANWEANIRRAKSTIVEYEVQGFYHDEGVWEINKLIRVVDDFATIDSDMLINTVEFNYSEIGGSITRLGLLPPDAYTQQPEATTAQKQKGTLGWF
jgi:prophage tail gpP-like protein